MANLTAKTESTQLVPPVGASCELPVFAAAVAHVAVNRGQSLPVAVTIQSVDGDDGGADKHFAVVDVFGRPVAIPCACHADAAAIAAEGARE